MPFTSACGSSPATWPTSRARSARRGFTLIGKRHVYHLVLPLLAIRADAESRILLEQAERRAPTDSRVQMMFGTLELLEGSADKAFVRSKSIAERQPDNLEMGFHRADILYLTDHTDLGSVLAALAERSPTNHL